MQAARITLPSVPCTSSAFQYRASHSTNLADTFAKARERLAAAAQAAMETATPRARRKRPQIMQIRRVRAGTTNHLTLPLFDEAPPCSPLY